MITLKTFFMIAIVLTLEGFACQATQATPIVGLLNIGGSGPGGPGGASGSVDFLGVAAVGEGTNGSFNIMQTGAPVAIASPSIFSDFSAIALSLWSVDGFTFALIREDINVIPNRSTTMDGSAVVFAPGAAPVSGARWQYYAPSGGTFTFTLTSSRLVPDSGTTMALFGVGLVAIGVCRAKFAKS